MFKDDHFEEDKPLAITLENGFSACLEYEDQAEYLPEIHAPPLGRIPCEVPDSLEKLDQEEQLKVLSLLKDQVKQQQEQILQLERRLILHPKSGIMNEFKMQQDLDDSFFKGLTQPCHLALCIFRLDNNFNALNKTLKASISDWILYQIGMRFTELLLDDELIYHTQDDEFVLILRHFNSPSSLNARVQSFLSAIQKPHILAGRNIHVGANCGIAVYPEHGSHRSSLLHAADLTVDQALREQLPFKIFEESIRNIALQRMDLHASIIGALESHTEQPKENQFYLAYQPQIYMETSPDGQYYISKIDAEVLLRWEHPVKGNIAPDSFIPFSEESGLILPLGNWVMYQVLKQLKLWRNTPLESVCLSVNISPKQFMNDLFMQQLARELRLYPELSTRLKLEITETCLLENPEQSIARMLYLKRLGLRFSLDDFGKGYSSLSYLSRLPLESLKLDQAFVKELDIKPAAEAVVKAVILMAKHMNLSLICEGVETPDQLQRLLSEGARGFQGFYFSKAINAGSFEKYYQDFLKRNKNA